MTYLKYNGVFVQQKIIYVNKYKNCNSRLTIMPRLETFIFELLLLLKLCINILNFKISYLNNVFSI